jgi:hypothetical protein
MSKTISLAIGLAAMAIATPAFATSTFQNTCSNISFVYKGNDAAIQAVCLRSNGTPNQTRLVLQGISNQNGVLTRGSGNSTFQQSCGTIQILVDGPNAVMSAVCRQSNGSSRPTSLSLNGINNNSGTLVQQ